MQDFTKGNITRQILVFAVPMLIGNLFQQLYSIIDAVVVGRFISGSALASVGVAININFFLFSMTMGFTTGASVVISQLFGAKQHEKLTRTVSTSIVFLGALSLVLTALGLIFSPFVLRLLGVPSEIFANALLYLRILMAGMAFPVFYNMYIAYLRALGDSRNPLYILIFCTVLNAGLNLLLVLVFGMGIRGVAVATITAQGLSVLLCVLYTRRSVPLLNVTKIEFDPQMLRTVLKYGAPAAIQMSMVSLAMLTITRLISTFGASAMAGITAANRIDQFAMMPIHVTSMALATFVAQNMGAGQESRALKGLRTAMLMMISLTVCISVLILLFGSNVMSLFVSQSDPSAPDILRFGLSYLNVLAMFYVTFTFLFSFNGFFRGAGDAVIAMVFPVVSLIIRVTSAYMMVYIGGMGPEALAWSMPIGWSATSLASWLYFRKRLWAGKVAVTPRKEQEEPQCE
ncbi:MAG: MATE family efflux transporter [Oscillospiraceae bacterium]|nr:MATE family efflux transporter [Oscillospiraceae bacterium]